MHECMQINKYHAAALHLMCMGTSCISSVSARHGFEQTVFIGWLSNIIIGVCPMKRNRSKKLVEKKARFGFVLYLVNFG